MISLITTILIALSSSTQSEESTTKQIDTADGPRYVVKSDGVIYDL